MLNVSCVPHTITPRWGIAHTPCCPAYLQFNKPFLLETSFALLEIITFPG